MEIRFKISKSFMKNLCRILNTEDPLHVVKEALAILNWAVDEIKNGRVILSGDPKLNNLKQIKIGSLTEDITSDIRPVRFFCSKCGKELWKDISIIGKQSMSITEAERRCICSDCLLEDIKEGGDIP